MITCTGCGSELQVGAKFCNNCGTAVHRPMSTGPLPKQFVLQDRYRIIQILGQGGMATVYQAEDLRFPGKAWAIKEMRDEVLPATDRMPAIEAFNREATILARLKHPNLPQVTDHFSENGRQYLVMECIEGQTLQDQIEKRRNRPFKEKKVVKWALQICDALDYLHSQDPPIIYRDLKPGNIIISKDGTVKLIDFGIARYFDPRKKTDTLKMGTTGYAPPEQYQGGGRTDIRSDIYALGATMHHMLTGRDPRDEPPFSFGQARPCKLNSRVSEEIEHVVMTALAYDPLNRYPSAADMRYALLNPSKPVKSQTRMLPQQPEPIQQQASFVSSAVHEVVHLPQMDDVFNIAMTEIRDQLAPERAREASSICQKQEKLRNLHHRGRKAVRQGNWTVALEILDTLQAQDGSLTDTVDLAFQAEQGWLRSIFPETAELPAANHAASDWAELSGAADLYAERLSARYVRPLHYSELAEKLNSLHLLVLTGPPGIGKFSTALALTRDLEGKWPIFVMRPDISVAEIDGLEGRALIWPYPFGLSTFAPSPLADRADILEMLLSENYLILTTTDPAREMALNATTLGFWPIVAEATMPVERRHYSQGRIAKIIDHHIDLAWRQGMITPRQRDLLSARDLREKLAPFFHTPLATRLFVEYHLAKLDPNIDWSERDLQLMVTETTDLRQLLTKWFAFLPPATRLFLTVMTWLDERPRVEVWQTYAALTRQLQSLWPDLPVSPTGVLAQQTHFCLQNRSLPSFKHPVYAELMREVVAEVGREYTVQCVDEMERAMLSAATDNERDNIPINVGLLLGELIPTEWDRIVPSLEQLAENPDPRVKWAIGRGLAHAAQKQPFLIPTEVSLLQQWASSTSLQLRLATLEGVRHLGRVALADVMPLLETLSGDANPNVRTGLVEVAAELAPRGWEDALSLLKHLGNDTEVSIREAVSDQLIRLAHWRKRSVLNSLSKWAEESNSLLNGTIARVLMAGEGVFLLGEVVPIYRSLLHRQDDAGQVMADYLINPELADDWPLRALTEIVRSPSTEVLQQIDHVLQSVAWQRPQVVVDTLKEWAQHPYHGVRTSALDLMASVGKAQIQQKDPEIGLNVLGGVYGETWFEILHGLAVDQRLDVRAQLVYLAPDFSKMDADRTVGLLAAPAQDEHERIRQLACLALAPFAARYTGHAVSILENLVGDESPWVREATIPALADGVAHAEVIPAVSLLAMLVRDPAVTKAAAPAFISVASSRIDSASPALSALSKHMNPALRNALLEVARQTGSTHPGATATFIAPLASDHSAAVREQVVDVCHLIAQQDPVAPLDVLAEIALDRHTNIRERAVNEIVAAGLKAPKEGMRILRRLLQERRSEVKALALQALQPFTEHHADAVLEAVTLVLRDPDLTIRRATVPVIADAGQRKPVSALEQLGTLLMELDEDVRALAQQELLRICGTKNPALLPVLGGLATHTSATVFLPAIEGLEHFVEVKPDVVLKLIQPVVRGDVEPARDAALSVLEKIARVRLTGTVRVLAPLLRGSGALEEARQLYWRVMRLPEGAPITIDSGQIIQSMAHNAQWDNRDANQALSLGETTSFARRRAIAKLTRQIK